MLTHFDVPPHTAFATHKHQSEQITYVLEGELCFEIENKTYRLVSGDTIIIPSNKTHRVWTDKQPARAIDAWSPVNEKYSVAEKRSSNN
jgi:quercetin dioxygenase-like cupin family protein